MNALELVKKNKIVTHMSGSHAYGMSTPESDVDIRGLFLADPINIRTPFYTVEECKIMDEEDTKFYELTHFMKLLLQNNPNIVETLWVDESDIMFRDSKGVYDLLRKHRSDFLSSKVAHTYTGYAFAQLKRIKGHNKWINNPQTVEPPRQIDYVSLVQNFTSEKLLKIQLENYQVDHRLIPYGGNVYGLVELAGYSPFDFKYSLNTVFDESHEGIGVPKMVIKFNKEEYRQDKEKWANYWEWKKNRNEKRSLLEEAHGFDTKHAAHLVRLLRTGLEILETGEVHVRRPDAEELLAIRGGSLTYDELLAYADSMDKKIKDLYKKTDLPRTPNIKLAAKVLMEAQDLMWASSSEESQFGSYALPLD